MDRRAFLRTLGAGAAALAGPGPLIGLRQRTASSAAGAGNAVNIILINVDDLGWTDLGCFGSRFYETPNIDRLASRGMKFTEAYASCAVCSPTRAAILTGRYPARIGLTDWIHHLDREAFTAVGSGRNPTEYVGGPEHRLLCPPNPYWMELGELTMAELLRAGGYSTGHVGKWHLGPADWYPERQGFEVNIGGCEIGQPPTYFDPYYQNPERSSIPTLAPRRQGEYLTDRMADEACRFLREAGGPFFLNLWPYAVHTPLEAPEEPIARFRKKSPTKHSNPVYAAMIERLDRAVGRVMETLDELGLAERTLVIFTSDNGGLQGYSTDNSPLRAGKGYPYEGGIRVPLIVCWPGRVRAGSVCNVPVASIDFLPTVCQAARQSVPRDRAVDGVDLTPLLKGSGSLDERPLFWHFPHYRAEIVPYSIVLRGGWKLIKRYEGRPFELFNLSQDIGESRDLSDENPERVRELDGCLAGWLREVGARMPRDNPRFNSGQR